MKTQKEIAEAVAGTRHVAGRTITEHTRLITFDAVTRALEAYRVELMREFDNDILEALASVEESTAADSMEDVFAARDQANDVLDRVGRTLRGQENHR